MPRKTFGGWGFAPETEYIGIARGGRGPRPTKGDGKKCTTVLAVIIRESLMFSNCECDSIMCCGNNK